MPHNLDGPPAVSYRWLRPKVASAVLDLPIAPVTVNLKDSAWQAFTEEESEACEEAWNGLSDDERALAYTYNEKLLEGGQKTPEGGQKTPTSDQADEEEPDDVVGVSIAEDRLFEVNVRSLQVRCMQSIPLPMLNLHRIASPHLLGVQSTADPSHALCMDV